MQMIFNLKMEKLCVENTLKINITVEKKNKMTCYAQ